MHWTHRAFWIGPLIVPVAIQQDGIVNAPPVDDVGAMAPVGRKLLNSYRAPAQGLL